MLTDFLLSGPGLANQEHCEDSWYAGLVFGPQGQRSIIMAMMVIYCGCCP